MKKLFLLMLLVLSVRAMATDILSCNINRSYQLIISLEQGEMTISKKYWASDEKTELAHFSTPHLIQYGSTQLFIGDQGRGGYFFLKIIDSGEDYLKAQMDINIFGVETMVNTQGNMVDTLCLKI